MADKLKVGLDFILPPEVSGGEVSEVFTVYRIITQPAIPPVIRKGEVVEAGSAPFTTVLLQGVNSKRQIALGLPQLAELGWNVSARTEGE